MPSHKEILQKRLDSAQRAVSEASSEVERLDIQIKAERKTIDELTAKYDIVCRQIATGASGDPSTILAERDRHSHRLRGLEALYGEATAAIMPLHHEHQAAQKAMNAELDREERERLEAVIVEANRKRDDAKAVFDRAEKTVNDAVWARTRFLRQLELKAQQRA